MIELKLVTLVRDATGRVAERRLPRRDADERRRCSTTGAATDRQHRLFFAQVEAAETIIFFTEARRDYLQGIDVPLDEPSDRQKEEAGYRAFRRYACKMATGSGKTTVMGMLAAWSILNKVHDRGNARYSDVVLVVCPERHDSRPGSASWIRSTATPACIGRATSSRRT